MSVHTPLRKSPFSALVLSGFFYFEIKYDLPIFTISNFGEKFRNARFARELKRQYEAVDDDEYFENRVLVIDSKLGTIDTITIRLDLPSADALIADLKTLGKSIDVKCTENTDVLIEKLAETNSPRSLGVHNTDLTKTGLERIKSMTNLSRLNIYAKTIAESKSLQGISRLEQLATLRLSRIKADDALLEEIAQLKNLRELTLETVESAVSDQGAQHLTSMPNLKSVQFGGAALAPTVYRRLKTGASFA